MVFKPAFKSSAPKDAEEVVKVQVTLTKGCHRALKQYAALRGMSMSQVMYLSTRYSMHREALREADVRRILEREGIPFDEDVVAEWRQSIERQINPTDIFNPTPDEAR